MIKELKNEILQEIIPFFEMNLYLNKGLKILKQDCSSNNVKVLLKGSVRVSCILSNGNELVVGIFKAPIIFIPKIGIETSFFSLFDVETETECDFAEISYNTFRSILKNKKDFSIKISDYCNLISKVIFNQIKSTLINSKHDALLVVLLRLYNTYGEIFNGKHLINLKMTNVLLAKHINTSVETVSRLITKLKKLNVIDSKDGYFEIIDFKYIETWLGCLFCENKFCLNNI